jgi:hypothetical protein
MRFQGAARPDRLRRARPARRHGLDRGRWEDPGPDQATPRKRMYRLTPAGETGTRELLRQRCPQALLPRDPAAKQAEAAKAEMHPWTAEPFAALLAWSAEHSPQPHPAWKVLAMTGCGVVSAWRSGGVMSTLTRPQSRCAAPPA